MNSIVFILHPIYMFSLITIINTVSAPIWLVIQKHKKLIYMYVYNIKNFAVFPHLHYLQLFPSTN